MNINEVYVQSRRATAVTAMKKVDDIIYLGLTGGSDTLAKIDTKTDEVSLCADVFPWVKNRNYNVKIHNSLGALADGRLIMGECSHFTWDGLPVFNSYLKSELPEVMLERKRQQGYKDISYSEFALDNLEQWNRVRDDKGGKIVVYDPKTDSSEVIADMPQFMYSQSMQVDPVRNKAYINTIPDNHFLVVDITSGKVTDHGRISEYGHHNMVIAPNGICYLGWVDYYSKTLRLAKYVPDEDRFYHMDTVILRDIGSKIAGNQGIDQWIVTKSGEIYVGMVANSLMFKFHWEEEAFECIGQATVSGRVAAMEEDDDGIIWIGAGYPNMHLVRFDPKLTGRDKMIDLGPVNDKNYRCYFHASAYHNNKLYLGETDGFTPSVHIIDLKQF